MPELQELPTHPDFASQVEQCQLAPWLDLDQSIPGARQLEFHTMDGATLLLDRSRDWPHSRILNLGVSKPATADAIQHFMRILRDAGVSTVMTEVSPIARPGTLSRLLTASGFDQTDRSVVVARHSAGMDEPDSYFRIRPAGRDDIPAMIDLMQDARADALDWTTLLAGQVLRGNWRHYLALEDGAVCGMSGLHLHNGMAWLSPIWVGAQHRNRGTQAALIAHTVREAEAAGAQWVVSTYPATTPGRTRNFERLGFSIVYLRNRFVWEQAAG